MDQGLKRVVARGVRPHIPYRNLDKVRKKLVDIKINHLLNLMNMLKQTKNRLRRMSFKGYGDEDYCRIKTEIVELKIRIKQIKQEDWFIRYKERCESHQETLYTVRRHLPSYQWKKGIF